MKCLYYPYSRCVDETNLKKALLLFDELVFLDSQPQFARNAMMREEEKFNADKVEELYLKLSESGAIKILNPQSVTKQFDLLITSNVTYDIRDDEYCKTAIDYSADVWDILYERLPPSFIEAFYPGAGTFSEAISLQNIIKSKGDTEKLPDWIMKFAKFRFPNGNEAQAWEAFKNRYKYVIGGNPHVRLEAYEVPFLQASSLRINEALLMCATNEYIPYTDSKIHNNLLNLKLNNTISKIKSDKSFKKKVLPDIEYEIPKEQLSLKIIDELIPSDNLSKLTFSELLTYKSENIKLLERFRTKVSELSTSIESVGYDDKYYRNLQKLFDKEVKPEVTKIKDELVKSYEKSFGKIIVNSIVAIIPTLSVSIIGGLNFSSILAACAAAEAGYLTTSGKDSLLEIISAVRNNKRNDYSYLLNLK
jgi:hypothetical protein